MEVSLSLSGWPKNISLLDRGLKTQELLMDISEDLLQSIDKRFDREETPEGKKWSKSWRAKKDRGKTLQHKGRFRKSWAYQLSGDTSEIGSDFKWANTHHFGAKIKPKKAKALAFESPKGLIIAKSVTIPARPVLGISKDDEQRIEILFNRWFNRLGAGL